MVFKLATGIAAGALSALSSVIIKPLEDIIGAFQTQHESAHFMKIEGLSILSKHDIDACESSVFDDYGYKWKLVFRPKGKRFSRNIALYVVMEDTASLPVHWIIKLDLQVYVVSHNGATLLPREGKNVSFNSSKTSCRIENWISYEQLSRGGFIENDSLIVGFEIMNIREWNPPGISRAVGTIERLRLIEKPQNGKFTWKITKFSTFFQQTHFSNPIVVGQRNWTLQMYPKGCGDGEGNSLSVFLTAWDYLENAPRAKTLVKFNLRVLNQLNGAHLQYHFVHLFGSTGQGCGQHQFLPLKDLHNRSKGFLVNDVMYIGVEFLVISITEGLS